MSITKRAYTIFFHTLLLAVYVIFFAVQFFFNFEAFSNTHALRNFCTFVSHAPRQAMGIEKRPANSSRGRVIRLNKRFQQEDMPPCEINSIPAPEKYTTIQSPGSYKNVFLLSIFPTCQPFRGPPVVA